MLSSGLSKKISIPLHLVMLVPIVGYGLYHLFKENIIVGTLLMLIALPLILSTVRLAQSKNNVLYSRIFILLASGGMLAICYLLGIRGLIFCFGLTSMLFFVFGFRLGLILSICFTSFALLAALNSAPAIMVLKFAIGLALSLIFTAFFAYQVEDKNDALEQQANRDPLTGALNRRAMKPALQEAIRLKLRYHRHYTLICVDLDHFKRVNDEHGHTVGDDVLKLSTQCLKKELRKTDHLYRFGGEEFAILLPETEQMDAMAVAEKLRNAITNIALPNDIKLTASFGVAELVLNETTDSWLKRADARLYQAKDSGRNQVVAE
ncbi:diguanylate cyclase [Corallincola holothuriorum]|uniref:diguanylate cyclase n=1 Tax=Corallincola holothuriorum TaxID=2282215 RepID=A0A368NK82_9GAMM|nr:GGDEF domain-containing protein [Corallincola holothuriorum]RCU50546.1 diguanylate cyclase [Corallincola holothuriorum]